MDSNVWLAILTALIALLTYLTWRVYRRIAWLTGATGPVSRRPLAVGGRVSRAALG